jgi:deazaflavin-dependent oxidoreductase (nitroreductase family)
VEATVKFGFMKLNEQIEQALTKDRVIDITTVGRKTTKQRRIEIWFHNVDGRIFISGLPGRRSWYANLLANPKFTFHLKRSVRADLPATAKPVVNQSERRKIISKILGEEGSRRDLEAWMKGSPLVEVLFDAPQ